MAVGQVQDDDDHQLMAKLVDFILSTQRHILLEERLSQLVKDRQILMGVSFQSIHQPRTSNSSLALNQAQELATHASFQNSPHLHHSLYGFLCLTVICIQDA